MDTNASRIFFSLIQPIGRAPPVQQPGRGRTTQLAANEPGQPALQAPRISKPYPRARHEVGPQRIIRMHVRCGRGVSRSAPMSSPSARHRVSTTAADRNPERMQSHEVTIDQASVTWCGGGDAVSLGVFLCSESQLTTPYPQVNTAFGRSRGVARWLSKQTDPARDTSHRDHALSSRLDQTAT